MENFNTMNQPDDASTLLEETMRGYGIKGKSP